MDWCPDAGASAQVKLMGDFDGWSRGIDLSAEETTGDSVFTRFTATLLLPKVTGSSTGRWHHQVAMYERQSHTPLRRPPCASLPGITTETVSNPSWFSSTGVPGCHWCCRSWHAPACVWSPLSFQGRSSVRMSPRLWFHSRRYGTHHMPWAYSVRSAPCWPWPEVCAQLQGEYQVKFQVDGEWRLAPDWPQVETADRSQNNVLVIE